MIWENEFIPLDKSAHDRKSFDCGQAELNNFLKSQASRHISAGISNTLVLPSKDLIENNKKKICAFYTVAPSSIARDTLPSNLAKTLPRYPIPVFLIAQLAVHKDLQNNGLGKITLIRALKYLWKVNNYMKAYAVIVDCLNEEIQSFYAKFGFQYLCQSNDRIRMYLPMKTLETLFQN